MTPCLLTTQSGHWHPLQADKLNGYDRSREASNEAFITLVNGAILKCSGLAALFLAGVLSITILSTSYSGEAKKKPIHIGVIAFSEPRLRTNLDQSLIRGLREQGYIEGVNLTIEWRYADGDRGRVP
jgi:hypothetical protein